MRAAIRLAVVLLLGVVVVVTPDPALASCAPAPSLEARLASATVAFVGTVHDTSDGGRLATVRVEEIWKGAGLPAEVRMDGTVSGTGVVTSADRTYAVGHRYLFLPANATSPFRDIDCSGTIEYSPAVAALRPASAFAPSRMADAATEPSWVLPLGVLVAVVLGTGLIGGILVVRRRRAGDAGSRPG
jgi:hypothetical protein